MEEKKCLIVDDDELILSVAAKCLTDQGYSCVTAVSGESALSLLAEAPFSVMVTDIAMNGMTGLELTRRAKAQYAAMPIVIMTGFADEYSYDEVIAAGAADFLRKPFSMKELETRVARVTRDAELVSEVKKKGKDLEEVSNLMIAGLQEEALAKVKALEAEINRLKETYSIKDHHPDPV
jgi:DNA-binding NtrC family response regulator